MAITLGYTKSRDLDGTTHIGSVAYIFVEVSPDWEVTARGDEQETTLGGACDIFAYTPSRPRDVGNDLVLTLMAESCETDSLHLFEWDLATGMPTKIYDVENSGIQFESLYRAANEDIVFEGYRDLDGARYIGRLTPVNGGYEETVLMDEFEEETIAITPLR